MMGWAPPPRVVPLMLERVSPWSLSILAALQGIPCVEGLLLVPLLLFFWSLLVPRLQLTPPHA